MSKIPLRVAPLVSVEWLANKLQEAGGTTIRLLDASWHMPFTKRNAMQEFYKQHIPGAQFFAIDDCCDKTSQYEHMVPNAKQFEEYVGNLGINNHTHVVLYDNNPNFGLFSAPRVWWMFRYFGHHLVSLVEGGLPTWLNEGYDTTDEVGYVAPEIFKASVEPQILKYYEDVEQNLKDKSFTLVDARPAGRFEGTAPEPRPGIKPGHIPGALNVPFASLLNQSTRSMKSPEEINEIFNKASLNFDKPVVAMCGSGVSACVIALAAYIGGLGEVAVYDGAWTEWYQRAPPKLREATVL